MFFPFPAPLQEAGAVFYLVHRSSFVLHPSEGQTCRQLSLGSMEHYMKMVVRQEADIRM